MTTEAPPRVDPRIHARRVEVQRAAGRKRLRIALVVAALFIAGGLAYLLLESPALDVDAVRVEGNRLVPADTIVDALGIDHGDALWDVDANGASGNVEELPWVASAEVSRSWPGTVVVEVREHRAVAWARRDADSVAAFAADGRVIADLAAPPAGATEVVGLRRVPRAGGLISPPAAAAVVTRVPAPLAAQVVAIDLAGDGVALDLARGGEVRLGTLDALAAKGAAALAVLDALGDEPFAYVDVRAPEHPVAGSDPAAR